MLTLKDSISRKVLDVDVEKCLKIYTCGPTVYDFAHIGNFRTFLWEDILIRVITFLCNAKCKRVMNLTDVDDKTIVGSLKEGCTLKDYTDKYIDAFMSDCSSLNILPADVFTRATLFVPEMLTMITKLLDKGYAYIKDGNIYFNISKDKGYGRLINVHKFTKQESIDNDSSEEVCGDFVLWKAWNKERDGIVFWDSLWGPGRPGWHLECSAMCLSELGTDLDIHAGGVDNIFPHHENEIAQLKCCTGKFSVKHWMHVHHLMVNDKKMSKSLGNFYTVRGLLEQGFIGEEIRHALLAGHYSSGINFTEQSLNDSKASCAKIKEFINRIVFYKPVETNDEDCNILRLYDAARASLCMDLNVSESLASLFDMIRYANIKLDNGLLTNLDKRNAEKFLSDLGDYLGFKWRDEFLFQRDIPEDIIKLADSRNNARMNKDWNASDMLRDEIYIKGFILIDEKNSYRIFKR